MKTSISFFFMSVQTNIIPETLFSPLPLVISAEHEHHPIKLQTHTHTYTSSLLLLHMLYLVPLTCVSYFFLYTTVWHIQGLFWVKETGWCDALASMCCVFIYTYDKAAWIRLTFIYSLEAFSQVTYDQKDCMHVGMRQLSDIISPFRVLNRVPSGRRYNDVL